VNFSNFENLNRGGYGAEATASFREADYTAK
jgi:hypothetical protein